jgi:hypothetical protein
MLHDTSLILANVGVDAKAVPPPSPSAATASPGAARRIITRAVLAFACGMAGANALIPRPAPDGPPRPAAGPDRSPLPRSPLTDLDDQIAGLSDRVEWMNAHLDSLQRRPRAASPAAQELSQLNGQVAGLAQSSAVIAPLRDALKRIDGQLEEVSQSVLSLSDEVRAVPGEPAP